MKSILAVFLVVGCFANVSRAAILPDACGDDKVKFDVETQKVAPPPAAPAAGQALFVFVSTGGEGVADPIIRIKVKATARIGVDGSWVGANKGNSYFAVPVDPGEHHLCANWQSSQSILAKNVGMASLVAAAGRIYYFETRIEEHPGDVYGGVNGSVSSSSVWTFELKQLSEDEGKYQLKLSALAKATPKK